MVQLGHLLWRSVLVCPEFCVVGAGISDEIAMSSLLNYSSSRQHQNLVGIDDCREAMSNEYGRPVVSYLANSTQNGLEDNVRKKSTEDEM